MIAAHQPVTLAAMEGLFHSEKGAPLAILGQPDMQKQRLDNPLMVPRALSFLTYRAWAAEVKGLDEFPRTDWPDNIPLVYFSYHIMVGLGTIFIAVLLIAASSSTAALCSAPASCSGLLMLSLPFPFIANTAGWITAEVGRQPWLIYGLMRTSAGVSPQVSAGNAWFTLAWLPRHVHHSRQFLFLFLVYREIEAGPGATRHRRARRRGPPLRIEEVGDGNASGSPCRLDARDVRRPRRLRLGAGIIHLWVARTDAERRIVLRSIGPVWDGNEVWLLAGGGTLYFAFPALYASGFSGFYLPLMMVLWLLILRGISIEFRSHVSGAIWPAFWDAVFSAASLLLAVFYGAALGNVVRGVPLDATGRFFEPLWTNFLPGRQRRNPRLVHDSHRRRRARRAHSSRLALGHAQDRWRRFRTCLAARRACLVAGWRADDCDHHRELQTPAATRPELPHPSVGLHFPDSRDGGISRHRLVPPAARRSRGLPRFLRLSRGHAFERRVQPVSLCPPRLDQSRLRPDGRVGQSSAVWFACRSDLVGNRDGARDVLRRVHLSPLRRQGVFAER